MFESQIIVTFCHDGRCDKLIPFILLELGVYRFFSPSSLAKSQVPQFLPKIGMREK